MFFGWSFIGRTTHSFSLILPQQIVSSLFTFNVVLTFFKWNFFYFSLNKWRGAWKKTDSYTGPFNCVHFKKLCDIKRTVQYSDYFSFTMKKSQNKDHFLNKVTDQNTFQICNFDQQTIVMFSVFIFLTCHENRYNDMFCYKYKPKSRYSNHSLGFSDWPVLFIPPFKR